jgi:MFS family permease
VGGGMTEVMISPIMEACPTDEKSGNMSFLHSFYCWGQVLVILLSGVFFSLFTAETHWHYFPMLLSLFPIVGVIAFSVVPIYQLPKAEKNPQKPTKKAVFQPVFWLFLVMMFCGGATENVMCQWASSFAESELGLSKSVGDLLGPCMFATMMGLSRILYGKLGKRFSLDRVMMACCVLSIFFYLLAAFAPNPVFALIGCALCGLTVGIFWPGIISRGAARMPEAGVMMFASFALAGDLGCLIGASAAGAVADYFGGDLRWAFCFATLFPIINFVILALSNLKKRTQNSTIGESET